MSGTCGDNRPGSLAPAHTEPRACALGYTPINHNKSDCLFAEIIRRADTFLLQKQKVAFIDTVNKSVFDIYGFVMIRRSANFCRKAFFNFDIDFL